jgi:long-subunit fatty acid transport protein
MAKSRRVAVNRLVRGKAVLFVLILLLLIALYHSKHVRAQSILDQIIDIPSSWNPVGSGARALGMGGAFIAVADDATASSWNPGGLIQLEHPEISIVGSYFHRIEDNTFGTNPEASGVQTVSFRDLNYLSVATPFLLFNRNMIVALTYQNLFDFNRDWDFSLFQTEGSSYLDRKIHFRHKGNLSAMGFSYSVDLSTKFSFGLTLNFWEDWLGNHGWEETTLESFTGKIEVPELPPPFNSFDVTKESVEKRDYSFSGFNTNIGFLWRVTANMTLGGVVKTPFTADLNITTTKYGFYKFGDDTESLTSPSPEDLDLEMPISYGIGLSYRFSDAFTISADIYRTEWQDFVLKRTSGETSPITGLSIGESDINPTTQIRLGFEYLFIRSQYLVPLRGGAFYDPAPAIGSPDDYYGISLGSGFARGRFIFDIAYQFRWGNNVGDSINREFDFSMDVEEHTVYSSVIIHF